VINLNGNYFSFQQDVPATIVVFIVMAMLYFICMQWESGLSCYL